MIFEGGILGGARKFHRNPYLNGTTFPFDICRLGCCHLTLEAHGPDVVCQIVSVIFACIGHQLDEVQPNLAIVG